MSFDLFFTPSRKPSATQLGTIRRRLRRALAGSEEFYVGEDGDFSLHLHRSTPVSVLRDVRGIAEELGLRIVDPQKGGGAVKAAAFDWASLERNFGSADPPKARLRSNEAELEWDAAPSREQSAHVYEAIDRSLRLSPLLVPEYDDLEPLLEAGALSLDDLRAVAATNHVATEGLSAMELLSAVEASVPIPVIDEVLSRRVGRSRFVLTLRQPNADAALADLTELASQVGARIRRGGHS